MRKLIPETWKSVLVGSAGMRGSDSSLNGNGDATPLSPPAGEQPLRGELFSIDQLERHAKSLAGWHRLAPSGGWSDKTPDRLLTRLRVNESVLRQEYRHISDSVKQGRRATPAAEWFLDNFYLIEEQIRTARKHLPAGYSRELPRLVNGPSAGSPRVYDIALELISHVDGRIDSANVR